MGFQKNSLITDSPRIEARASEDHRSSVYQRVGVPQIPNSFIDLFWRLIYVLGFLIFFYRSQSLVAKVVSIQFQKYT